MIRMDSSGGGGGPGGAPPSFMGDTCYDWRSEENAGKWRGLFVEPLQKVLIQVHPQFTAKDDALEYVESLLIRLLANLTSKPPLTVTDVEVSRFKLKSLLYQLEKMLLLFDKIVSMYWAHLDN